MLHFFSKSRFAIIARMKGYIVQDCDILKPFKFFWLLALVPAIFLFCECRHDAEKPDNEKTTQNEQAQKPAGDDPAVEKGKSMTVGRPPMFPRLTPVSRSDDKEPSWVEGDPGSEPGMIVAVGKGSSVKGLFQAQQAALRDAAVKIGRRAFGDKTKVEPAMDLKSEEGRIKITPKAKVWLEGEPVLIENIKVDELYHEEWDAEGHRVYVMWLRVFWPEAEYRKILSKHSI